MHAWRCHDYGHYRDVLRWEEIARPVATGATCVIRVAAAGVNFPDILNIAGKYQVKGTLPYTPGSEAVGIIVESGPDSPYKLGERVTGFSFGGGFADYMQLAAEFTFPTPASIPDEHAAGFVITYHTSYFALVYRAQLQPGETLLVHGGAGGVGSTAIQLGKALGARVIATAGGPDKVRACLEFGADEAIDYQAVDFAQEVLHRTGGRGADVIYDPVGGETFERSTKCIAFEGRLLVIGFTSGTIPSIAANRILLKNIAVVGLNWPNYALYAPHRLREAQNALYKLYADGTIQPRIHRVAPLSDLLLALDDIEHRRVQGKIILRPT